MSCEANALASNLICGAYVRPSVAVCIAGSARTFHQPLVHRTARTNFIEAFGGVITVFAALKLGDERPDNLGTSVVGEDEKVINALKHVTPAVTRALKRHALSALGATEWCHHHPRHGADPGLRCDGRLAPSTATTLSAMSTQRPRNTHASCSDRPRSRPTVRLPSAAGWRRLPSKGAPTTCSARC